VHATRACRSLSAIGTALRRKVRGNPVMSDIITPRDKKADRQFERVLMGIFLLESLFLVSLMLWL
jgi:hypothetical protein